MSEIVSNPAKDAGLMPNDRIVKVGSDTTAAYNEMQTSLLKYAGKQTTITVMRGDSIITLHVTPTADGKLGFKPLHWSQIYPTEIKRIQHIFCHSAWMGNGDTTTWHVCKFP